MDDVLPILGIIALGLAGILSFFTTFWQNALQNFSEAKLEDLIISKDRQKELAVINKYIEEEFEQMTLSIMAVRTIADVVFVFLTIKLTAEFNGGLFGIFAWMLLSMFVLVVFCRNIPRELAKRNPEGIVLQQIYLLHILKCLFIPVTAVLSAFNRFFGEIQGQKAVEESVTQDEILTTLEDGEKDGAILKEERTMIENIIDLGDLLVSDIMTPRTEMTSLNVKSCLLDAKNIALESKHSRIPIYKENRDNIIGVLFVKDLLKYWGDTEILKKSVQEFMRTPHFVPETKRAQELLKEFLRSKNHMAIVLDEYGGTSGIVTLEDTLEEIVGEIPSEVEEPEIDLKEPFKKINEFTIEANASMHIDDVNEELDTNIPEDDDIVTIAGYVFSQIGRIPKPGEKIEGKNVIIDILNADARRVKKVRIMKKTGEHNAARTI